MHLVEREHPTFRGSLVTIIRQGDRVFAVIVFSVLEGGFWKELVDLLFLVGLRPFFSVDFLVVVNYSNLCREVRRSIVQSFCVICCDHFKLIELCLRLLLKTKLSVTIAALIDLLTSMRLTTYCRRLVDVSS